MRFKGTFAVALLAAGLAGAAACSPAAGGSHAASPLRAPGGGSTVVTYPVVTQMPGDGQDQGRIAVAGMQSALVIECGPLPRRAWKVDVSQIAAATQQVNGKKVRVPAYGDTMYFASPYTFRAGISTAGTADSRETQGQGGAPLKYGAEFTAWSGKFPGTGRLLARTGCLPRAGQDETYGGAWSALSPAWDNLDSFIVPGAYPAASKYEAVLPGQTAAQDQRPAPLLPDWAVKAANG